jgi:threonine aldolase
MRTARIVKSIEPPDVLIDLRSDTVTEMPMQDRLAMAYAITGDMLYGEDKYINTLESMFSDLFYMHGIWVPSCTMANLIAILLCRSGLASEVLVGESSHINTFERKNATFVGGIAYKPFDDIGGNISIEELNRAYVAESNFFPLQVAVALENTHNLAGGRTFMPSYLSEVCEWARQKRMRVHLDGARIFNASVRAGVPLSAWELDGDGPDTIAISLSKGLGTPAGGLLLVRRSEERRSAEFIRKALGGTMHTGAGYLAAAVVKRLNGGFSGDVHNQIDRDHQLASMFAARLRKLPEINVVNKVETNIVYLTHSSLKGHEIVSRLQPKGILCSCLSTQGTLFGEEHSALNKPVRFVFHRGIIESDVEFVIKELSCIA